MRKSLLIAMLTILGLQTFSFSPGIATSNFSYVLPANKNAISLQEFIKLTPKKYEELTGKKMSFKQRIAFTILKTKLKRQAAGDKASPYKTDIGLLSLIFGGAAWVFAFIPAVGVISIGFAVAAIILGILGLGRKRGDTKSVIGLVLGGLFVLLLAVALAAFASGGWY